MAAQDDAQAGSWLTLSEAAARSGLHKEALRARAKRGQLQAQKNNRGETLVMLPADLLTAAQSNGRGAAQGQAEQLAELVRELEGELAEARGTIMLLEERAAVAHREADELEAARRQVAEGQAAAAALRERIARLEGEAAGVRATAAGDVEAARRAAEEAIAAKGELVEELRRELEWHRRPWWRRWISDRQ